MPSNEEEDGDLISSEEEEKTDEVCYLSHPAHPHTLSRRTGSTIPTLCFSCLSTKIKIIDIEFHYHCTSCDVEFHHGCHWVPRKMTHPYHPQHPLILSFLNYNVSSTYGLNSHRSYETGIIYNPNLPNLGNTFDNCTWCEESLKFSSRFYRCSVCNFCLDESCSVKFPLPYISNPKSHHHSLIFLPRPVFLPCDACGLVDRSDPSYACFQCSYVVHESCIKLPRVIKITRHLHHLFYTPFLSSTNSSCRICYETVDNKYGQYYCNHGDCSYVVHSKCATHETVWDGRELEWEHEEFGETTEDVEPFKKGCDGLIKYFFHEHNLKLEKYDGDRDADKQCQVCTLHIDSRDFYRCMQCEFFLHEVCANLPRKLDHALHHHPLFLDPARPQNTYSLDCVVCGRAFNGFRYKCSKNNCEDWSCKNFQVDVGCILVPDCFTHKSHEHPLFIPIISWQDFKCECCKDKYAKRYLRCTLCDFSLCYKCATIPDKLHDKYDSLPLSLCYGEDWSDETYWCEVCEKKLDPRKWFYLRDKPCITIHSSCVFGPSAYMKPGDTLIYYDYSVVTVKVICNSSNQTRPFCHRCNNRCSSSVYFKFSDGSVVCSLLCE
ncbi:Protein VACUOLELESS GAMETOPHYTES [Cardamine amara subsp. amara]|uniref:Protein VACUOLELESS GAMETOPHYTES n=1 Tax=Cardamine amara subsp. amara TaxID=228776 RepID=A0ABD1C7R8_CARAN